MLRGEILLVNLDSTVEAEKPTSGRRRSSSATMGSTPQQLLASVAGSSPWTVPVTLNVARVFPFQVRLSAKATGLHTASKAQAEQVRSVAVQRIGPLVGRVPADLMERIDEALRLHLAL